MLNMLTRDIITCILFLHRLTKSQNVQKIKYCSGLAYDKDMDMKMIV